MQSFPCHAQNWGASASSRSASSFLGGMHFFCMWAVRSIFIVSFFTRLSHRFHLRRISYIRHWEEGAGMTDQTDRFSVRLFGCLPGYSVVPPGNPDVPCACPGSTGISRRKTGKARRLRLSGIVRLHPARTCTLGPLHGLPGSSVYFHSSVRHAAIRTGTAFRQRCPGSEGETRRVSPGSWCHDSPPSVSSQLHPSRHAERQRDRRRSPPAEPLPVNCFSLPFQLQYHGPMKTGGFFSI